MNITLKKILYWILIVLLCAAFTVIAGVIAASISNNHQSGYDDKEIYFKK